MITRAIRRLPFWQYPRCTMITHTCYRFISDPFHSKSTGPPSCIKVESCGVKIESGMRKRSKPLIRSLCAYFMEYFHTKKWKDCCQYCGSYGANTYPPIYTDRRTGRQVEKVNPTNTHTHDENPHNNNTRAKCSVYCPFKCTSLHHIARLLSRICHAATEPTRYVIIRPNWLLTFPHNKRHYLNQCWPRSMSPYDITRSPWEWWV